MTRTERANPSARKAPKNANTAEARRTQLSRSLTKLLRHQAENEKIPISPAGWVKLEDLLAWKGLSRVPGGRITVDEIFDVVQADGWTGKGRFEVKYIDDDKRVELLPGQTPSAQQDTAADHDDGDLSIDGAATGSMVEPASDLARRDVPQPPSQLDPTSKNTPGTQSALIHHSTNPSTPATSYLIRAAQGHSMKTIQSPDLLTPLTLSTPHLLPSTVVHGTFYGAWGSILASDGLKPMGRNNVHFATGPALSTVLPPPHTTTTTTPPTNPQPRPLTKDKVISGMRADAQILIYIDLQTCLSDIQTHSLDMNWYISGNGVVLTEGLLLPSISSDERSVPTKYWLVAVEVKNGLGVLWRQGEGVVKDLPEKYRSAPLPWGKNARARQQQQRRGNGNENRDRGGGGGKEKAKTVQEDREDGNAHYCSEPESDGQGLFA